MKKILSVILCLVLALGLAAPAVAEGYTAGTYTASADGNNGPVTVEVDFDDSAITAVRVTEHAETAGICETPIERIPAAIVENQSLAVDAVAGCDQHLQRHSGGCGGLREAGGRRPRGPQGRGGERSRRGA